MPRSVRFHPAAVQDSNDSVAWYEARSVRAALRFLAELDRVVARVAVSSEEFPILDGDVRRATFRHFPFYLAFRVDSVNVLVLAVAHAKRRPGYWRERI